MRRNVFRALLPLMALPLMVACPFQQKEDDSNTLLLWVALPEYLEISGKWKSDWTTDSIQASKPHTGQAAGSWDQSGSGNTTFATIVEFDNVNRVLFKNVTGCTQVGWCTEGYSRVVWTYYKGNLYSCDVNYGKATLSEAKSDAGSPVNYANPTAANSCGFWSWTKLKPR